MDRHGGQDSREVQYETKIGVTRTLPLESYTPVSFCHLVYSGGFVFAIVHIFARSTTCLSVYTFLETVMTND